MGKKSREEREQKRESYAEKRTREKRKFTLIAGGIIAGVAIVIGITGYMFYQNTYTAPDAPPGAGTLGDEHEHAAIKVMIFGDEFDFSSPAFQVKNRYIHFEGSDGETIHRHASGVPLGFLFDTLNIGLTDQCYIFPDKREFCTNEDYSLKLYINHQQVPSILDYVLEDNDRILISYGNENSTQIEEQLARVDSVAIARSG
ncbi:MAG: protein-disulfide isomerase [Nitrosopumilaceae archaeon]